MKLIVAAVLLIGLAACGPTAAEIAARDDAGLWHQRMERAAKYGLPPSHPAMLDAMPEDQLGAIEELIKHTDATFSSAVPGLTTVADQYDNPLAMIYLATAASNWGDCPTAHLWLERASNASPPWVTSPLHARSRRCGRLHA
jgi:hypothetical protein